MTISLEAFATRAVHAGVTPDPTTGAVCTPVYLTSTYVQSSPGVHTGYEYSRTQNPTRFALARNIAALEGADYGLCFASGCAATTTVIQLLDRGLAALNVERITLEQRRRFIEGPEPVLIENSAVGGRLEDYTPSAVFMGVKGMEDIGRVDVKPFDVGARICAANKAYSRLMSVVPRERKIASTDLVKIQGNGQVQQQHVLLRDRALMNHRP